MSKSDDGRDAETGKFTSGNDRLGLFELVAKVARVADPDEPETVSQPRWDRARAAAGVPDAPSARAIYGRLKIPWPEILRIALDPDRNTEQSMVAHTRADAREPSDGELFYALNLVARELGRRSFTFYDYTDARRKLLRADRRRNKEQAILDDVLPTAGQILAQYDDWNEALAANKLEPVAQEPRRGMPIQEVYDLLIELTGKAPGRRSFDELRTRYRISVERFPVGKPWPELEQELRDDRARRGLETPTVPLRERDWETLEIPEAALAGLPRKIDRDSWPYERVLRSLAEYVALPGITPSQRDYLSRRKKHGWPALRVIQEHGTWTEMIERARELVQTGVLPPLEDEQEGEGAQAA